MRAPDGKTTIEEKIKIANQLWKEWGETLESEPHVAGLLRELSENVTRSRKVMVEVGIEEACRECEEKDGGSCCGRGLERRYGPIMLLINLLFGVALPEDRLKEDSCYFLGNHGCILRIREILCVNYLCDKIENRLTLADLVKVQNVIGEEMDTTFLLHETIKKMLRKYNV